MDKEQKSQMLYKEWIEKLAPKKLSTFEKFIVKIISKTTYLNFVDVDFFINKSWGNITLPGGKNRRIFFAYLIRLIEDYRRLHCLDVPLLRFFEGNSSFNKTEQTRLIRKATKHIKGLKEIISSIKYNNDKVEEVIAITDKWLSDKWLNGLIISISKFAVNRKEIIAHLQTHKIDHTYIRELNNHLTSWFVLWKSKEFSKNTKNST
jgi:hypothetical protein